jgi:transposase
VLWAETKGKSRQEKRMFGTFTQDLLAFSDWLRGCGVTHVAMESTGVYWKPVWHILEGHCELLLVNAQHVKAIPGKKTDRKDSAWLAELLQHGLLKSSFVPPEPIRELRDLTRYRVNLAQECNRIANRIQKAIVAGEQDVGKLAEMSRGLLRRKIPELQLALKGHVSQHHRFLLKELLDHLEFVEAKMTRLEQEIADRLGPLRTPYAASARFPALTA